MQLLKAPPITVEQYEHFEGYPGLRDELIFGEIVMSPQPKPLHQQIAKRVERLLDDALLNTGYVAQRDSNIECKALNSMPAPDVFVVSEEEWWNVCDSDEYIATPPVLTVEVISPANRKLRVEQKIELYLTQGVREVWTIHPKRRLVRVYQLRDGSKHSSEWVNQGSLVLPAPLRGTVEVADIFARFVS